jgi:hypothetical protein
LESASTVFDRLFWLYWISLTWAAVSGVFMLWLIVQTVLNCLPGAQVLISLPADQDYPPHAGSLHYSGSAYVVPGTSVTFTQVTMLVSHLPVVNAILLGLGQIFTGATNAGIAWCIFALVRKLREDEPFSSSTAKAMVVAGLILGIGSTASSIATASAQATLHIAYLPKYGELDLLGSGTFINFVPLFFAGVLFALASVFRYGGRLEKERARLKRETEGLV